MPEIINTEIAIIGAGPAGLTAAIRLGQKGIPCVIADKARFPREKICGDGLSGKVISTLKRIDPDYITELTESGFTTPSYASRFFSPRRKMLELGFKTEDPSQPPGFICRRIDFDNFLMSKARKYAGNRVLEGIRISKILRENGRVILQDIDESFVLNCRLLLIASGSNRQIIRQMDPDYPGMVKEGIGVRGYFENVTGADQLHAIEIHFFKELLPWYFWIFPFSDGSANVGLAMPESQAKKLKTSLKELLFYLINNYPHIQKRFANATLRGKIEAHRLPVHSAGGSICAGDNYLLLGDAARLVDPFTGEGIGNAMVSGFKAADIAEKCFLTKNYSFTATEDYQKIIAEKLYPELDLSLKLQGLARKQQLLNLVIGNASRDQNIRNLMTDMLYSTNAKSKLNNPWFYLKLLLGL